MIKMQFIDKNRLVFFRNFADIFKLFAINTIIAVLITIVTNGSFWAEMQTSFLIGCSIAGLVTFFMYFSKDKEKFNYVVLFFAIILGVINGYSIDIFVPTENFIHQNF